MRFFKIFILAIIFPVLMGATVHKFYASTTRVEYVPQEQSLQIITEIFTDDIQQALTERNLRAGTPRFQKADPGRCFITARLCF